MLLVVGEHVLGDLEPKCARMATGFAGGVGDSQQEMCGALSGGLLIIGGLFGRTSKDEDDRAALGATQCARVWHTVHAPGGLGSCALVVERAAAILLELLTEADGGT
jgi:hypothetical protein